MLAIETTNLSRSFKGKAAVKDLNMRVPEGSIYGFIGQNGAGKWTTQKMICGLLHPDAGSISLYGKSGKASEIRSRIGAIYIVSIIGIDFSTGFIKNILTVHANKRDYILSKLMVSTIVSAVMIVFYVVLMAILGTIQGLPLALPSLFTLRFVP